MKKQFKQPVVTFNNPAVFTSPDDLQEEGIYMNPESVCTVDKMPRDTTEETDKRQTPSIVCSSSLVKVAVCWGILLVIMALRIHFTSVISTKLSSAKECDFLLEHLVLTNEKKNRDHDDLQAKIENLKEENQQVKAENQQVKAENQQVKEENQQVKEEIKKFKEEIKKLKAENQQVTTTATAAPNWTDWTGDYWP